MKSHPCSAHEKQKLLGAYEEARCVLGWLVDNDQLAGVSQKAPGWRDRVEDLAKQYAAGPGKAGTNYRRMWLDSLLAV